ncbi:hypothetical protein [Paracoccus haematequi]|uniref:hypothetical protein n=1 Tax=Paracoccus haematequi TaxID=2491866 RepID=UPI000F7D5E8E|nr:hypothetical protein [Paracoccus haematequi]
MAKQESGLAPCAGRNIGKSASQVGLIARIYRPKVENFTKPSTFDRPRDSGDEPNLATNG